MPDADRADDADQPPAPQVERGPLPVGAEPGDGQLTRAHRRPPRAPRGAGRRAPGAARRRSRAGRTRRTARGRRAAGRPARRHGSAGRRRALRPDVHQVGERRRRRVARARGRRRRPARSGRGRRRAAPRRGPRARPTCPVARTSGRPLASGTERTVASCPGSASTMTTRFGLARLAEVEREERPGVPRRHRRRRVPAAARGCARAPRTAGPAGSPARWPRRRRRCAARARSRRPSTPPTMKWAASTAARRPGPSPRRARAEGGRDAPDPLRVGAVPLAGVAHHVDHAALAQERETRHRRRDAESPRPPSTPPSSGRRIAPTRWIPRPWSRTSGASASNSSGESWFPATATTGAISASRRQRARARARARRPAGPAGRRRRPRRGSRSTASSRAIAATSSSAAP